MWLMLPSMATSRLHEMSTLLALTLFLFLKEVLLSIYLSTPDKILGYRHIFTMPHQRLNLPRWIFVAFLNFLECRSSKQSQKLTFNFLQVFFKLANVSRHRHPLSLRVPPLTLRFFTYSRISLSR